MLADAAANRTEIALAVEDTPELLAALDRALDVAAAATEMFGVGPDAAEVLSPQEHLLRLGGPEEEARMRAWMDRAEHGGGQQ